ncbi:MAG: CpXC domain-containing protein [Anaerolineae bacterium]|nr:CpXC domain-containing protein [Anaerolineae bacterium]
MPVEQILDVRVDPSAKSRLLSGTVNSAVCPSCGTGGALNLPLIYHDPANEVALLFLPIGSGPTEVERQRAAGRLARQLMDAMPPEERKGYLLQPETFISMESMIKRLLEIDGVTEEDVARSQQQHEFLVALLQASPEAWPELVAERTALVDEQLFNLLDYLHQITTMGGQNTDAVSQMDALREYLSQETDVGRLQARRMAAIQGFADDPSRESLLAALVGAPDAETVQVLVQSGMPLMDYAFFQQLNQRIEQAISPESQQTLQQLRRSILDQRDALMQRGEEAVRERAVLLTKLMTTEDPRLMASSHLSELDDVFFTVMGAQIREAEKSGDEDSLQVLSRVAAAVNEVMEAAMPPDVALARRLMAAASDEQLDKLLSGNRDRLTAPFLQVLSTLQESLESQGQEEAAARMDNILTRARRIAPVGPDAQQQRPAVAAEAPPSARETTTASGLIIAKH